MLLVPVNRISGQLLKGYGRDVLLSAQRLSYEELTAVLFAIDVSSPTTTDAQLIAHLNSAKQKLAYSQQQMVD